MKVQLIWPNFDCPIGISIGVAYLSGALKAAGHETSILHVSEMLDYGFDPSRIVSDVRSSDPDLIAVSCGYAHYPEMAQLGQRLKTELGRPILFGGIHTSLNTRQVMEENPWLDFANVGEGDESIVELCDEMEAGRDATSIANVWARPNGRVVVNPSRPLKKLESIPWMDLEGWPQFERITNLRRGWVNVYMNRGCPYRCTYCHNNGVARVLQENFGTRGSGNKELGYLRLRGIDDMIAELRSIQSRFPVQAISFNDDTFTMDRDHTLAFLRRYKEDIGLPWVCNTTVLDVDRELLEIMKDAGCDLIRFGVETATRRIKRNILKRDFSNTKTHEVFAHCREIGQRAFAYNILANPGETRDEMLDTLRLNTRLLPSGLKVSLGYPFPGTEYHDIAKSMDVIDESRHLHNFIFQSKLKWSDADRLWIDKVRRLYWWWMNVYLANEASGIYAALLERIEVMPAEEWFARETEERLWDLDFSLSKMLETCGIRHYAIPFRDRPEIALLNEPAPRSSTRPEFSEVAATLRVVDEH